MGLLDDAIREHLELKRLKGANPGDLARDEQEALGEEGSPGEQAPPSDREDDYEAYGSRDQSQNLEAVEEDRAPAGLVAAAQETIELDMESVLATRPRSEPAGADGSPADIEHRPHVSDPEEPLEWEMPPEGDVHDHQDSVDGSSEDESIEDVLEETPDFLRQTPEQDRLWFEQRPPRDFDFNE